VPPAATGEAHFICVVSDDRASVSSNSFSVAESSAGSLLLASSVLILKMGLNCVSAGFGVLSADLLSNVLRVAEAALAWLGMALERAVRLCKSARRSVRGALRLVDPFVCAGGHGRYWRSFSTWCF